MDTLKAVLQAFSLSEPININPVYVEITGSLKAGYFLTFLMSCWAKNGAKEFSIPVKSITNMIYLTSDEIKSSRALLLELGIISFKRKGLPATTVYKINNKNLFELLNSNKEKHLSSLAKTTNLIEENPKQVGGAPLKNENSDPLSIYNNKIQEIQNTNTNTNTEIQSPTGITASPLINEKPPKPERTPEEIEKIKQMNFSLEEVYLYLKSKIGGTPDGSIGDNRRYARLLLNRFEKDYPDEEKVGLLKRLIDIAYEDKWHSKNSTNFKYLYYNAQKIIMTKKRSSPNAVIL